MTKSTKDFSSSFDARDWAKAFVERVTKNPAIATDENKMIGWFANAIMRGYDEAKSLLAKAKDKCEVIVLLDRSGSMSSIKNDMEGGYAAFIAEQKGIPGECVVTLVQFDSQSIDTVYESKAIADVPALVLAPRNRTPLLDALGETLTRSIARNVAGRVLFLVITDGQENASTKYTKPQIKALIENQTKAGWAFSFLGANVDAFAEAQALGISTLGVANFTANSLGVKSAFVGVSDSLRSYRSGNVYELTDEQRAKMVK